MLSSMLLRCLLLLRVERWVSGCGRGETSERWQWGGEGEREKEERGRGCRRREYRRCNNSPLLLRPLSSLPASGMRRDEMNAAIASATPMHCHQYTEFACCRGEEEERRGRSTPCTHTNGPLFPSFPLLVPLPDHSDTQHQQQQHRTQGEKMQQHTTHGMVCVYSSRRNGGIEWLRKFPLSPSPLSSLLHFSSSSPLSTPCSLFVHSSLLPHYCAVLPHPHSPIRRLTVPTRVFWDTGEHTQQQHAREQTNTDHQHTTHTHDNNRYGHVGSNMCDVCVMMCAVVVYE